MLRVPGRPLRLVPLVVVLLLGAALPAGCGGSPSEPPLLRADPSPAAVAESSPAAVAEIPVSDVLREWDEARAAAFAEGDVAALRGLYVAGSAAGTADVRLLRAYTRRGLRVEGMRMQLLAVETLRRDRRQLRLRVTDRLVGAVAVGPGRRLRLPSDTATTRVVELVRTGPRDPWKVAWVRG